MAARRRPLTILTAVLAAAALGTGGAPGAGADIPADPAAWLTARGVAVDWTQSSHMWWRTATVVADGALPGRAGNRHTVTVQTGPSVPGPRPRPPVLHIGLTARDEQCDGGACRTLWAGSAVLPGSDVIPPVAADGAVRVQAELPASAWTTSEPEGAPAPVGDTTVDLTLTPQDWKDPRLADPATSDGGTRRADLNGDEVGATASYEGDAISVAGAVAGVPAQRVAEGAWRDSGGRSGSAGPALRPIRTFAQAQPYLPAVRNGTVNRLTYAAAFWQGDLAGRAPLVSSTGYRLPGNAYRVQLYSQVVLDPGGRVEGTVDGGQAFVSIEGRQCAAGQAWDACAPVVLPIAIQPTSRYAIDFGRSVRYRFAPLVQEALPDGTTRDRGRLDVRVDIRPGGAGDPSRTGWYVRSPNQREWQYTATVRYPAAGTATIGGRALRAGTDQSYRYLEFATLGQGPMP